MTSADHFATFLTIGFSCLGVGTLCLSIAKVSARREHALSPMTRGWFESAISFLAIGVLFCAASFFFL